jgi:hypothetical protein
MNIKRMLVAICGVVLVALATGVARADTITNHRPQIDFGDERGNDIRYFTFSSDVNPGITKFSIISVETGEEWRRLRDVNWERFESWSRYPTTERLDLDGGRRFWVVDDVQAKPTPEPSSLLLFGTGLLSLCGLVRRRQAKT